MCVTRRVFSASKARIEFQFVVGKSGIGPNGCIVFQPSPFWGWSPAQTENPDQPGYTVIQSEKLSKIEHRIETYKNNAVGIRLIKGALNHEDVLTFVYGAGSERARTDDYAESAQEFVFSTDADGDGSFQIIDRLPTITVLPHSMCRLLITGPSRVDVNTTFNVNLAPLDCMNNYLPNWKGKIYVGTVIDFLENKEQIMNLNGAIRREFKFSKPGIFKIQAKWDDKEFFSNPIRVIDHKEEWNLYWGDIHGHSVYSDGTGTPDDYYRYARDAAGLDFSALTDHDDWGFYPLRKRLDAYNNASTAYQKPGNFITFYGYEWTSWEFGHRNIYKQSPFKNICNHSIPECDVPEDLLRFHAEEDILIVPHHLGGGPIPFVFGNLNESVYRIAEVVSIHGVSESYGSENMIYRPQPSGFYRDAINDGYRWGAIGSSDSHDGHPGLRTHGIMTRGMVAVYASSLTRSSIFDALKNRRCYATSGARIDVNFQINDAVMGSVLELKNSDLNKIRVQAQITGESDLERIRLIRNGELLRVFYGNGIQAKIDWMDREPPTNGCAYYYLVITQMNGEMAVTSPIWIS